MAYAILIDIMSIQKYVFSSNKLKENIGASYIIENLVYKKVMIDVLEKLFKSKFSNDWKEKPETIAIDIPDFEAEIGYIGGGNALVFFKEESKAKLFVKTFSKECLIRYPTLNLAFGIKPDFNFSNYPADFQFILSDLKSRKAKHISIVSIPKYGITADCPWSNETAEVKYEGLYISRSSNAKLQAAKGAKEKQKEIYKCLNDKYNLTDEIDKLGQNKEASYIAVVHIDGNGMGKVFSDIKNIIELRTKSKAVSDKANSAMQKLLAHIISLKVENKLGELDIENYILPIRPILVGGDDVTFICEGRLGLYLAEKFIEFYYDENERKKTIDSKDKLMDGACAGVAIVKSHFPFYKAVQLAEELCAEAKKESRKNKGSYISYYYSSTTFSGSLEELRKKTQEAPLGRMCYGPYKLFEKNDEHSIENLKNGIMYFKGINPFDINKKNLPERERWPKNKVMLLREIIADSESSQKLFEKEIYEIGLKFPCNKELIWDEKEKQTPYFDQIELMDFYLDNLIKLS